MIQILSSHDWVIIYTESSSYQTRPEIWDLLLTGNSHVGNLMMLLLNTNRIGFVVMMNHMNFLVISWRLFMPYIFWKMCLWNFGFNHHSQFSFVSFLESHHSIIHLSILIETLFKLEGQISLLSLRNNMQIRQHTVLRTYGLSAT